MHFSSANVLSQKMSWCSVCYYHNNSKKNSDKTFFRLPTDTTLKSQWVKAINRESLPKTVYVCSDHFDKSCFDSSWDLQSRLFYTDGSVKRKLLPVSVPTIFPHKPQPKERKVSKLREERATQQKVFGTFFYQPRP